MGLAIINLKSKYVTSYASLDEAIADTAGQELLFPAGTYVVPSTILLKPFTRYVALGEVILEAKVDGAFTTCKDEFGVDVSINSVVVKTMIDVTGANNLTLSGQFQLHGNYVPGLCAITASQNPVAGHAAESYIESLHIEDFSVALGGFTTEPVLSGSFIGMVRTKRCVDDVYIRGNSFDDVSFSVLRLGEVAENANVYDGCASISLLDSARMLTIDSLFIRPDTYGTAAYLKYGAYMAANAVISAQKCYVEGESKQFFYINGAGCLLLIDSLKVSSEADSDPAQGHSIVAINAAGATVRMGVDQRYLGATDIDAVVWLNTHSSYYGSSRIVEIDSAVQPSVKELIAFDTGFTSGQDHIVVKSRDGVEHYRYDGAAITKTREASPEYYSGLITTVGTSEELVKTITLPAKQLNRDGQTLRLRIWGKTAATANSKRIRVEFGGTAILNSALVVVNNLNWSFELLIQRTALASQQCLATGVWNGAVWPPTVTQTTKDFASDQNLDIYLTSSTAAAGITIHGMMMDFI